MRDLVGARPTVKEAGQRDIDRNTGCAATITSTTSYIRESSRPRIGYAGCESSREAAFSA
jgi:hypothetical protein